MTAWLAGPAALPLVEPLVMGILNVTPDSFSDGGSYLSAEAAVAHGFALRAAGADIVDVGGESTRPGAEPVPVAEEIRRVVPVIGELAKGGCIVSVDTMKPEVASAAIAAGASILNDVAGLRDPSMVAVAAETGVGVVIMHMRGLPGTMQTAPEYEDVIGEIRDYLGASAERAIDRGVRKGSIVVDPGVGFGKQLGHNLEILRRLDEFSRLGFPIMIGTSRKAFLGAITGKERPTDRDLATAVTVAMAVERGASIVRVHEPASAREAVAVARAIVSG